MNTYEKLQKDQQDAADEIQRRAERRRESFARGLLECDDSVDPRGWDRPESTDKFAFRREALTSAEDNLRRELAKYAEDDD